MEPINRIIKIIKANELFFISGGEEVSTTSVRHFEQIKIVSIKIKGIDPTDVILQILFRDTFEHRIGKEMSFYFGDFGRHFINQNDFLVLYPNDGKGLIINKPEHTEDVIFRLTPFDKGINMSEFECKLNVIFSDSSFTFDFI